MTYQMYHSETFDNFLSHSMFQNPLFVPPPDNQALILCALYWFRAFLILSWRRAGTCLAP